MNRIQDLRNMINKSRVKSIIASTALVISPITVASSAQSSHSEFTYESPGTSYNINLRSWVASISFLPDYFDGRCTTITVGGYATKYTVQLSLSANMSNPIENKFITTFGGGTSYKFTGLKGNTTYYYRALGEDSYRPEWTNVKSFTTSEALTNSDLFKCM